MTSKTIGTELTHHFDGELINPSDNRYDEGRRLFNGRYDRRPALIARCRRVDDVIAAVAFAGERNLPVCVRSSGHGFGGDALRDGALALDLRPMRRISIDPQRRRAVVEPGATWGELDAATQAHGVAVTGARGASIGVVGFTTGGGSGWLERGLGLACDNLVSAEVVTGDGRLLSAAEDQHDDLLWGLRGGGPGSGVITQIELALHRVGPQVLAGQILHPISHAPDLLEFLGQYLPSTPEQLGLGAALVVLPDLPSLPPQLRGRRVIGVTACWHGDLPEGERVLRPLRKSAAPIVDRIAPMSYVEAQRLLESPPGHRYHSESAYFPALDDERIAQLVAHANAAKSPGDEIVVLPWTGALLRNPPGPLPRPPGWLVHILAQWRSPTDDASQQSWAQTARQAIAEADSAAFPNLCTASEDMRDFGKETARRIAHIRRNYDPAGLLHPFSSAPRAPRA
jgi:FAD binding domain